MLLPPSRAPSSCGRLRALPLLVRLVVLVGLFFALAAAACGSNGGSNGAGAADAGGDANEGDGAIDAGPVQTGPTAPPGVFIDAAAFTDGAVGPALASIDVAPPVRVLAAGTAIGLTATGIFSDGSTFDVTRSVTWTVDNAAVVGVASGVATAMAPGTAHVEATLNGLHGTAIVTVSAAAIVTLTVTPAVTSVGVGGTVSYAATATLSDGSSQDVSSIVAWSATPSSVASVGAGGLVTALGSGSATVTATLSTTGLDGGSLGASVPLAVTAATLVSVAITPTNPAVGVHVTLPFKAIGTWSDGSIADVTTSATWSSTAPGSVSIASAGTGAGTARSLSNGTSIVTAAVGTVTTSTTVTVSSAPLLSITVNPSAPSVAVGVGGAVPLTATGLWADQSTTDLTGSVTWSADPGGVVSISNASGSAGTVTGLTSGTATVSAALDGVVGTATVTSTSASLVSLALGSLSPAIPAGGEVQLTVRGTFSDDTVLDLTSSVTWTTGAPTIATIGNAPGDQGVARGLVAGSTTVTASIGPIRASTTLTVTSATLVSLNVSPGSSAVVVGTVSVLVATATFSDGTTQDVTRRAVWSTSSPGSVAVSNAPGTDGQVTGVAPGTASVTATLGGMQGVASITVTAPALFQVVVTPATPTTYVGQALQMAAIATFTDNTTQDVTAQAGWTSSSTATATVGATGLAMGVAPGSATLTASYGGMSGSATLLVAPAASVAAIAVSPASTSAIAGIRPSFTATATFSDQSTRDVTLLATWTSSDASVASVATGGTGPGASPGAVIALLPGTTTIQAAFGGAAGGAALTVTSGTVTSLALYPASDTVPMGTILQFVAAATFSDGTLRNVASVASWQSSTPSVATIASTGSPLPGLATAGNPGTTTITATVDGVTASTPFAVTAAEIVSGVAPLGRAGSAPAAKATSLHAR